MKIAHSIPAVLMFLASQAVLSQEAGDDEYSRALKRNEILEQNLSGFYANNLSDLVQSSDVIVRGRWGGLIRHETHYGRGVTREEMMKRVGATEETIGMYGLPTAYYEIEIDEIIKGDEILVGANALTLGRLESPEILNLVEWLKDFRDGEHLFFLHESAEGGEFVIPGHMFDMKRIGEAYFYRAENGLIGTSGSRTDAEFLESVRDLARE